MTAQLRPLFSMTMIPSPAVMKTADESATDPGGDEIHAGDLPRGHRPGGQYRSRMRVGDVLIAVGTCVVVVGLMVRVGWFSWFGNLPGDIRTQGERGSFFFPITSSIVVSVVGTLIVNIVARLFNDR